MSRLYEWWVTYNEVEEMVTAVESTLERDLSPPLPEGIFGFVRREEPFPHNYSGGITPESGLKEYNVLARSAIQAIDMVSVIMEFDDKKTS